MAIVRAELSDKVGVATMMGPYGYELDAMCAGPAIADPVFVPDRYFDLYWQVADRHPFLILANGETVGFCLVREVVRGHHAMAEFYVALPHRRNGVGHQAAFEVFEKFPGRWQVAQMQENVAAQKFWRRVIGVFTDGNFDETWSEANPTGPMQMFNTGQRANRKIVE